MMNKNKKKLTEIRQLCNDAKIDDEITCPSCNSKHIKKSYQSVFCKTKKGTKCKDNYWNNVDPNKRNNTTRISPANARWSATQEISKDSRFENKEVKERYYLDDNSSDHGDCYVEPCEYCGMYAGGGCRCD